MLQLGISNDSWFRRKQTSVALSSADAKYMATILASCEAIWLHKMLTGLFGQELEPTVIVRVALNSQRIQCYMIGPKT